MVLDARARAVAFLTLVDFNSLLAWFLQSNCRMPGQEAARWFGASRRAGVLIPRAPAIMRRVDRCL
jgi:hypothetical protein